MSIATAVADVEATQKLSFKIHVRFITSRCVATRVDARERPEWPPHPGRLYMALVAAHFETDGSTEDKVAERGALEWLADLSAPLIQSVESSERSPVTYYVPVNDAPLPNKAMLQSAPGMPRSRQSRAFPTVIPMRPSGQSETDPDVTFEWRMASGLSEHLPALERLCRETIRVGHSSSLVMAWTEAAAVNEDCDCWEPSDSVTELTCRIAVAGELDRLKEACRVDQINLFGDLKVEIDALESVIKTSSGTAKREMKNQLVATKNRFAEAFGETYKSSLRPPEPTPASLGVWQGYRRTGSAHGSHQQVHANSYFERDLLVLAKLDGPTLNVERTLGLTQTLRAALIGTHGNAEIPAWLCGHDSDGNPTSSPHAAFLALPFVGYPHADGHLMGLAIALPKGISPAERGRWLSPLLVNQETGEAAESALKLWGQDLPDWTLQLEERPSPPLILQNETWTKPSTTWASVTPVVLDRFPKASRTEDRSEWHAEVIEIIKLSCTRAGLPEPVEVDVDSTAWHVGVPRAWAKSRRIRSRREGPTTGALGDGFPSLPSKQTRPAKPQVHVWLRFDRRVAGPVLIGAGRFQGYGMCKPITSKGAAT
ncbi:MAG: type I-U CRISPR-associated protein Csb2 [Planctomycetaceae bacterium]